MKKPTDVGGNRTGITGSLAEARRSVEGSDDGTPDHLVRTDNEELRDARFQWAVHAEPVGTMPEPPREEPSAFLDRLNARLAFERTGVRLYEALLVKLEVAHVHEGGPTRDELEQIRDEELEHFALLLRCIEELGADPTAVTPAADVTAVATAGVLQVVTDPRTTLTQGLEAMLVAELADTDGWMILADLADRLDQFDMADEFRRALAEEEDHVARLRQWVTSAVVGQAGIEPTPRLHDQEHPRPPR